MGPPGLAAMGRQTIFTYVCIETSTPLFLDDAEVEYMDQPSSTDAISNELMHQV
jgi:hypothetical protein